MIVVGCDAHKRTHTCVAVTASFGELKDKRTARAVGEGFSELLGWACAIDTNRVWVLEDCRSVSAGFEAFLLGQGERVLRVPPHWTAKQRRSSRNRGKSDELDALAIARVALREGLENLPQASVDQKALEIKLLVDHRENLVQTRTQNCNRLRDSLHQLWPEIELPSSFSKSTKVINQLTHKLSRADQSVVRVRIARQLLRQIKNENKLIKELTAEIEQRSRSYAPSLEQQTGCASLTAARFIAEIAGIKRFRSDAQLARLAGVAPIEISSGRTTRNRLDRGGNRSLNAAFHRMAITRARVHPESRQYIARLLSEGKTKREALRCLKRNLTRLIWKLLTKNLANSAQTTQPT